MFGDIRTVGWISKIELSKTRAGQLRKSFSYGKVHFHYSDDVGKFETLIESFKVENDFVNNLSNKIMGENKELDKFIVMEDVSGLADKSNEFGNFLIVSAIPAFTFFT